MIAATTISSVSSREEGVRREGPGEKGKHCYGFFFIDYPHPPRPPRPSPSSLQTQCNVKWCTCYLFPFPFLVEREREKRQLCVCFTTLWGVILDLKKQNTVCADIYTKTHTHIRVVLFFLLPARALDSTLRRKGRKKGVVSAFADAALIPLATLETSERAHTHTVWRQLSSDISIKTKHTRTRPSLGWKRQIFILDIFFFCLLHNFQVKMQSALHAIQLIATFIFCFVPLRVKS